MGRRYLRRIKEEKEKMSCLLVDIFMYRTNKYTTLYIFIFLQRPFCVLFHVTHLTQGCVSSKEECLSEYYVDPVSSCSLATETLRQWEVTVQGGVVSE